MFQIISPTVELICWCGVGWGWIGGGVCRHLGRGLVQEIESPDFRSSKVGISGNV